MPPANQAGAEKNQALTNDKNAAAGAANEILVRRSLWTEEPLDYGYVKSCCHHCSKTQVVFCIGFERLVAEMFLSSAQAIRLLL